MVDSTARSKPDSDVIHRTEDDKLSTPIVPRALLPDGELIQRPFLELGYGLLDLSGPCMTLSYPLSRQYSILHLWRMRQYPFPSGIDVERFTLVLAERRPLTKYKPDNYYLDNRNNELVLIQEHYDVNNGVYKEVGVYSDGDEFAADRPWWPMEWTVPIPSECPSQFLIPFD